ncbi:MAG: phage antirepressor [Clostridium sp.]|uniref:phage antirepressor n=1 Tax=Clostridium sp. TaxID=1506 RepID=UPI002A8C7387|nr:phage antirepressor [Clostridium sp.]MDY5098547.1 phage antirepressor [Clostridium sp.]
MKEIQIFKNEQFGEIRAVEIDGEGWLVGKDVAEILGYTNPQKAIRDHIDEEDKTLNESFTVNGTKGILINESGLYSLILSSKLPGAKKFKRWVTSEVLPSIRKHGTYMTESTLEEAITNPDFLIKLAVELKNEKEQRKALEKEKMFNAPKVSFAEHVAAANNSMLVREVAKLASKNGIKIGEKRLYGKLREWGLIFKNSCEATQRAIEQGLIEVTEGVRESSKGKFTYKTSRVTGKGQIYIISRLKKEG